MEDERGDIRAMLILLSMYTIFWIIDFGDTRSVFGWILYLSMLILTIIGFIYLGRKYIRNTRITNN